MRILFITDPLETFKTYKDSTFAMMTEAAARGHELFFCLQSQLSLSANVVEAMVRPLELTDDAQAWYRLGDAALMPLSAFDAVLMRKDPPFDMEYVTSTWLLELAERRARASSTSRARFATTRETGDRPASAVHHADAGDARCRPHPRLPCRA
jgi:glutathione synthase